MSPIPHPYLYKFCVFFLVSTIEFSDDIDAKLIVLLDSIGVGGVVRRKTRGDWLDVW